MIFNAMMHMHFRTASIAELHDALNALRAVLNVSGVKLDIKYCGRNPYEFLKNELIWRYAGYPWRAEQKDEQDLMNEFKETLAYLEEHVPKPRSSMISVSTVTSSTTLATEELSATSTMPTRARKSSLNKRPLDISLSLPFGGRIVRIREDSVRGIENSDDSVLPTSRSA